MDFSIVRADASINVVLYGDYDEATLGRAFDQALSSSMLDERLPLSFDLTRVSSLLNGSILHDESTRFNIANQFLRRFDNSKRHFYFKVSAAQYNGFAAYIVRRKGLSIDIQITDE